MTGWPLITVEAGFLPVAPGLSGTAFLLDDPGSGKLDTGTLGPATAWTTLNGYIGDTPIVQSVTISRASTRQQGPLVTYQAGTAAITLSNSDARFSPENLAGPYVTGGVTLVRPMIPVRARATWGSTTYDLFSGYVRSWTPPTAQLGPDYDYTVAEATDAMCVLEGVTVPAAGSVLGAGELSGARVARILTAAGWYAVAQSLSDIDPGRSALQGTTLGGTALSLLQLTADSEIGELYVDGGGAVVFRDRYAPLLDTRSNTVQAVFGDNPGTSHPAGTELAYEDITRPDDDTTMANDIQATREGGTLQRVQDAASIARFLFPRSHENSGLILQTDTDALNWAQYVLNISKDDESRFDTLTVHADADPDNLFPQVLGRDIGDRIQVWRRPPQGSGLPYSAGSVTSPGTFQIFLTVPVPPGTYTVSWTVTLSGTTAAADANNFGLTLGSGPTLAAPSVNPGAPGVYPQPPVTFTTAVTDTLTVKSWGNTPTTGAVYGAAIPSPIVKDCFISSIEHTITVDSWMTVWGLRDATRYGSFLVLDNPILGQLDANSLAFLAGRSSS